MNELFSNSDWLINLLLFVGIFIGGCWLWYGVKWRGISSPLACLLEDAPPQSLTGQSYRLMTPLMTPFACLWEDAPSSSLQGQSCTLATPIACLYRPGWLQFYRQSLGKRGLNYWQWRSLPFSDEVESNLSQLLRLPMPSGSVRSVLASLGEQPPQLCRESALIAFRQWHQQASQGIGLITLQDIYLDYYGLRWEALAPLIGDSPLLLEPAFLKPSASWWHILGVNLLSSPEKVETAYKRLIRLWHPDRNSHIWASVITIKLNDAYGQYQNHCQSVDSALRPLKQLNFRRAK
jgi:hypothetical protein